MKTRGIIALDGMTAREALRLADRIGDRVFAYKANDLMYGDRSATEIIMRLRENGKVFVDVKGHDIPATVGNTVKKLVQNGADLVTAHASGGVKMLKAAVEAYGQNRVEGYGILAVSVLTSLSPLECSEIYGEPPEVVVARFARFAVKAGCYGIVCSPLELPLLSRDEFKSLKKVTPGVRLKGANTHDQARVSTPGNAVRDGADFLVIGREVTEASDPIAAIAAIDEDISQAERS